MLNAYKVDVLRFLGQVSPNGSPALMLPLPPFISPSLFSPTASFYFPIILYIFKSHTNFFIPSQYPHSYCILALPPYPIFAFLNDLWAFFACISFPFYLYMYIYN